MDASQKNRQTFEILFAEINIKKSAKSTTCNATSHRDLEPRMQLNHPPSSIPRLHADARNRQISRRAARACDRCKYIKRRCTRPDGGLTCCGRCLAAAEECVTTDRHYLRKRPGPKTDRHKKRSTPGLDSVKSTDDYIRSTPYFPENSSDLSLIADSKLFEISPSMQQCPSLSLSMESKTLAIQSVTFSPTFSPGNSHPTSDLIHQLPSEFHSTRYDYQGQQNYMEYLGTCALPNSLGLLEGHGGSLEGHGGSLEGHGGSFEAHGGYWTALWTNNKQSEWSIEGSDHQRSNIQSNNMLLHGAVLPMDLDALLASISHPTLYNYMPIASTDPTSRNGILRAETMRLCVEPVVPTIGAEESPFFLLEFVGVRQTDELLVHLITSSPGRVHVRPMVKQQFNDLFVAAQAASKGSTPSTIELVLQTV
ncbi:hypothetical protein GG344DRAFT_61740 [Lentinula edodes]|nr:hypothetical protein GG344DRAFT_61740 [Lentinula edodes]